MRLPELALGVALVAGSALGAVVWQQRVTAGREVVVAAQAIARGSSIGAGQLTTAQVRGGGDIALVGADDAAALVGMVALVDIPAGLPVSAALLARVEPLSDGDALASVAIARGHSPSGLAIGDVVRVIVVPRPDAVSDAAPQLLAATATVWSVEPPTDYDTATVVTMRLPLADAASVSGADDVRLVRVEDPT